MIALVLLGLGAALSLLLIGRRGERHSRWFAVGLTTALVAGAALATALGSQLTGRMHAVVVVVGLVVAAVGGSHVTTVVFEAVDQGDTGPDGSPEGSASVDAETGGHSAVLSREARSLRSAGQVLRGGAWIGILERLAVFATLVARWPEGIAVVLAVKGLGRYPELRTGRNPGLAERFIIGTLVSVLWAALCAYAASGPALG
jgi:cytochrome c biogenesis protein CcdA